VSSAPAPLSGVILAGGQSRRMGQDKAFLQVDGRRLLDRVLDVVSTLSEDIVIVTNTPEQYDRFPARLVRDVRPGTGALGGIYTGLLVAEHPRSLVVACDMPFLNVGLLQYMAGLAAQYDVVIPYLGEDKISADMQATARARDLHPLHAIYSKRCLKPIERAIDRGDLRTIAFLSEVGVRFVGRPEIEPFDPEHRSFFNANTPEELDQARQLSQTQLRAGS
jgi:molybdopterin-guanine dinucleotide biosynthesis protein A